MEKFVVRGEEAAALQAAQQSLNSSSDRQRLRQTTIVAGSKVVYIPSLLIAVTMDGWMDVSWMHPLSHSCIITAGVVVCGRSWKSWCST